MICQTSITEQGQGSESLTAQIVGSVDAQGSVLTAVPAQAPATVEPMLREEYEKATQTIDGRR